MKLSKNNERIYRWFLVAAWTAVIYLTLPYAPLWRDWLAEKFTGYFFPVFVLTVLTIVFIFTLARLIKRKSGLGDYLFLIIVSGGYIYTLAQIKIVVEQVHFLEYGLLAILIINALRIERKDSAQYLNALLIVALIGIVDEFIQGLLVNRVGELHDVYLNIIAGALALIWYRYCYKPDEMEKSDWRMGFLIGIPIAGIIVFAIGIFNSRISEFGYYIEDPQIGAFYSRMPAEQLLSELPKVEYFRNEVLPLLFVKDYAFLLDFVENPLHAEALVHIFRRDVRLERDKDYPVAHRENQILEKYFHHYIADTKYHWKPAFVQQIADSAGADTLAYYVSPVSAQIITAFSERTQWIIIFLSEFVFAVAWIFLFRIRTNQPKIQSISEDIL